jgi:transposase-like protein
MIQPQAFQPMPFARPYCPECAAPMFIVPTEPDASGNHTSTFECPVCRFSETTAALRC